MKLYFIIPILISAGCANSLSNNPRNFSKAGDKVTFCGKTEDTRLDLGKNIILNGREERFFVLIGYGYQNSKRRTCFEGKIIHLGCVSGKSICNGSISEYGLEKI